MRTLGLISLSLLLFAGAAPAGEFPVQIDETVLENGMKVFSIKRPGAPQAACMLAVRTGSSSERAGYTGIAHFLEHMLFKGTEKIGVKDPGKDRALRIRIDEVMADLLRFEDEGADEKLLEPLKAERDRLFKEQQENLVLNQIFKIYADAGSSMTNAFTSDDMTAFFTVLPPHKIELFFWIESERFRRPVFRQFHSEKNVVREERRLSENRPGYTFNEEFGRVLFGSHPYAHPVIGYHDDLRRLTREDMREFFDTFYKPDNMFLVVTGDVESDEVFRLAERYFGDWKPYAGKRPRIPAVPPAKSGPTRVHGTGPGSASLTVAYRLPPAGGPADVEAEMLGMYLGDEEGALHQRLVTERGVATSVSANVEGKLYGSVLRVDVDMKEGHAPEEAEADVIAAVQRLVTEPIPEKDMAALRRRYRAQILGTVKSDMRMGFTFLMHEIAGSWHDIERNLARARVVPAEAIRELAAANFVPENRVVGIYETGERPAEKAAAQVTARRPEAAPSRDDRPGHWTDLEFAKKPLTVPTGEDRVFELSNGIRVVAVTDPDDPTFRVEAILMGGSAEDPSGKEGTAQILAATLGLSGTPDLPREAVRERLEEIVGAYRVSSGRFAMRFSLDTFPQDVDGGMSLFSDLLLHSVPDPEVAAEEKARLISRLADRATRPGGLSRRAFRELLMSGDVRVRRPTAKSVGAIGIEDLTAALARHRDPRRLILVVSGPIPKPEIEKRLEAAFGEWQPGEGAVPVIPSDLASEPAMGLHVMDFDSSQGYVLIGARTVAATDEEYPAFWMLQAVLSRRIFNRIRSNEGLAYQASASLSQDWEIPSLFSIVFQSKNASVPFAMSLALEELEKLAETGPDADEMENARQRNRAGLERTFGRSAGRAGAFATSLLHPGVDLDWHAKNRAAIVAMTPEAVSAAAKYLLDDEELLIVCVGNRAEMESGDGEHPQKLADFGRIQELAPPATGDGPETPSAVVLGMLAAMARGDVDAVAKQSGGELEERLSTEEGRQRLVQQGGFLGRAEYEVKTANEEGDKADVTVSFLMRRGEETRTMELVFDLIQAGDRWICTGYRPAGR